MRRLPIALVAVLFVCAFAAPTEADAQQSVTFFLGGFVPKGEDARVRSGGVSNDVLVNNLDYLIFDLKDFNGATIGGEWLTQLGDHFEAGLGLGYYRRTSPSIYRFYTNLDRSEIEQDLRLRIVPFTATIRFAPLGRYAPIQPYIGAGVGVFNWRYSETGQFVDFTDFSIFRDSFSASGSAAGPLVLGGIAVPIGPSALGFEMRYQAAEGKLPSGQGFSAPKIDLGGMNYLATFRVRF